MTASKLVLAGGLLLAAGGLSGCITPAYGTSHGQGSVYVPAHRQVHYDPAPDRHVVYVPGREVVYGPTEPRPVDPRRARILRHHERENARLSREKKGERRELRQQQRDERRELVREGEWDRDDRREQKRDRIELRREQRRETRTLHEHQRDELRQRRRLRHPTSDSDDEAHQQARGGWHRGDRDRSQRHR